MDHRYRAEVRLRERIPDQTTNPLAKPPPQGGSCIGEIADLWRQIVDRRTSGEQFGQARPRMLADLKASRPEMFVDAVAPGTFSYRDQMFAVHERFPELAAFIRTHYRRVAEVRLRDAPAPGVRIYRIRD